MNFLVGIFCRMIITPHIHTHTHTHYSSRVASYRLPACLLVIADDDDGGGGGESEKIEYRLAYEINHVRCLHHTLISIKINFLSLSLTKRKHHCQFLKAHTHTMQFPPSAKINFRFIYRKNIYIQNMSERNGSA